MRYFYAVLGAILTVFALAGCSIFPSLTPSDHSAKSSSVSPAATTACHDPSNYCEYPTIYKLDGKPYTPPKTDVTFKYTSHGGHLLNQTYYWKAAATLDKLLPQAHRLAHPLTTDYDSLDPQTRSLPRVTQRALAVISQRAMHGQTLNLIPSMLSFLYKGYKATTNKDQIESGLSGASISAFAAAYIEQKGSSQTVVLVTEDPSAGWKLHKGFYTWYGNDSLDTPFTSSMPGTAKEKVNGLVWTATLLKGDCSAERTYRTRVSSLCAFTQKGDSLSYKGNANIILEAPVHIVEDRGSDQFGTEPVQYYNGLDFEAPITADGTRLVSILDSTGYPYSRAPTETARAIFAGAIADGGSVYGGDDIIRWPAYSVLG